jgi:hypothetical protein
VDSHILVSHRQVSDRTLWIFKGFIYVYDVSYITDTYVKFHVQVGCVKSMLRSLLHNFESIRNVDFNECELMLHKIKWKGLVS